ncbi:hypothetical protein OY671_010032, partial [Metschnikowia pulcherrima]
RRTGRGPQPVGPQEPDARTDRADRGRRGEGFRRLFRRTRPPSPRQPDRRPRHRDRQRGDRWRADERPGHRRLLHHHRQRGARYDIGLHRGGNAGAGARSGTVRAGEGRSRPAGGHRRGSDPSDLARPALHAHGGGRYRSGRAGHRQGRSADGQLRRGEPRSRTVRGPAPVRCLAPGQSPYRLRRGR